MDRTQIKQELRRVESDFAQLVQVATPADLRRRTTGTRWTNRQLLFHMVFGYLIVRTLMPMVHVLGRLGWGRRFAATLNAARRPFHLINYVGSVGGGQLLPPSTMVVVLTRTLHALKRRLDAESHPDLALTMPFPTSWDPYFAATMTVQDVYHYGTQHYDHHRRQLTLQPVQEPPGTTGSRSRSMKAQPAEVPRVSASLEITAPAAQIFGILTDPRRHREIDGSDTIRRCIDAPSRLGPGSQFTMAMRLWGIPYRVRNRVVEFDDNRLIAWRHFEPQHWRFELQPTETGTQVTETFDYSYWHRPGRLLLKLFGWPERNRRAITDTLQRLASAAQTSPQPS